MTDDEPKGDARHDACALWQGSGVAPIRTTPDDIARRARRLDTGVANLSTQLYVAAFFNVAIFILIAAIVSGTVERLGAAVGLGGWTFLIGTITRHRQKMAATAASGDAPTLVTYRAMLERQRDFFSMRRSGARAAATLAGPLTFLGGFIVTLQWNHSAHTLVVALIVASCFVALVLTGVQGADRQYRSYQRQIDELL